MNDTLLIIRDLLQRGGERLVLVESCTSGWLASQFGVIPGISECFCGSLVVYRNASKHEWLGISDRDLNDAEIGPVSERVTMDLAISVLQKTPEATISAAITGHLGPGSPTGLDGIVFVSIGRRNVSSAKSVATIRVKLEAISPCNERDFAARQIRQQEAGNALLIFLRKVLEEEQHQRF
jgi:nicotinamide-nucleotide amidase